MDGLREAQLAENSVTLHNRILGDMERSIVSGAWPPGHRIPFEVDLAAAYGCSRMTVNKVMTQLSRKGLIERRKKSGSFVVQPSTQSAVLEISDIAAEAASLKLKYSYTLLKRTIRSARTPDRRRLAIASGSPLLDIVCVHRAGSRPFCLEERLISLASVPEAQDADFSAVSPGTWLVNKIPWSAAEHRINAVASAAGTSAWLDIATGTACLVVERRTWSNERPVTQVRLTYPGDSHVLVAKFTPTG